MSNQHDQAPKQMWDETEPDSIDHDRNDAAGFRNEISGNKREFVRHGEPRMEGVVSTPGGSHASTGPLPGRRGGPSRPWSANGDPVRPAGEPSRQQGLQFDIDVRRRGYAWWYIDAISDDGQFGLTTIAFIGSVFSPYYAWSKARDPFNHTALNVALYGPNRNYWSMTERGKNDTTIEPNSFQIGPSGLRWDGNTLVIDVHETTVPIPGRLRGQIRVTPSFLTTQVHAIDENALHRWRPIAPSARVEVEFSKPGLNWSGHGYLDTNNGDEPLEDAFQYWDWSRANLPNGETVIFYNTDAWSGASKQLALKLSANGEVTEMLPRPEADLSSTAIWRIARRTRADEDTTPNVVRTLEDTPFYSRSMIESTLFGVRCRGIHESLSGGRLRSPIVKCLLPFRMPRIAR